MGNTNYHARCFFITFFLANRYHSMWWEYIKYFPSPKERIANQYNWQKALNFFLFLKHSFFHFNHYKPGLINSTSSFLTFNYFECQSLMMTIHFWQQVNILTLFHESDDDVFSPTLNNPIKTWTICCFWNLYCVVIPLNGWFAQFRFLFS